MERGLVYLVAIPDWATRKVLAHRLSISMTTGFCVEALEEAIGKFGAPEVSNTDRGSQFTSADFTKVLQDKGIKISMDGKRRWVDNVFVERLWRSVKYVHVYLHAYGSVADARTQLAAYFASTARAERIPRSVPRPRIRHPSIQSRCSRRRERPVDNAFPQRLHLRTTEISPDQRGHPYVWRLFFGNIRILST